MNLLKLGTATMLALVAVFVSPFSGAGRTNTLNVNGDPKVESEPINLIINPVENFNFLTRAQILGKRALHVAKYPQLVSGEYHPSDRVFAQIEDGKPWWGMIGSFVYGKGSKSIEGEAEESRFLSNPFLLVAASPWTAEIWNGEADTSLPDFPFCWLPASLTYHLNRRIVEVCYDVSAYDGKIEAYKTWLKVPEATPERTFGLIGYNARDFGYEYIYVPVDQSSNITNPVDPKQPVEIGQYIHCGGSSGYAGGCNNMSPERPPIDQFKIQKLPATVKVLLWTSKPSMSIDKPDMTVLINFK